MGWTQEDGRTIATPIGIPEADITDFRRRMPLNQDVSKQSPRGPASPSAGHNPHQLIRALSMKRGMTQQDLVPTKPSTKKLDAAAAPSPGAMLTLPP